MGLIVVVRNVPLELVDEERSTLSTASLMSDRVFNLDLVEDSAVVEFDQESISDGALGGVVIFNAETLLLHAVDLGAESVYPRVRSRSIGATEGRRRS